jgi:hypothetical protein
MKWLIPLANGISLAAAASKHIVEITAPAGKKVRILGFRLSGDSNTQTDKGIAVEKTKCSTVGTGTAVTLRSTDDDVTGTAIASAIENVTVEPTVTHATRLGDLIPSGGWFERLFDGDEFVTGVAGNTGLRLTNPASNGTVVVHGSVLVED